MVTDSVETASNLPMILILLPFLSSGFVPTDVPARAARAGSPSTSRSRRSSRRCAACSSGTPIGNDGLIAVAWCVVISIAAYVWAMRLYERVPARTAAA